MHAGILLAAPLAAALLACGAEPGIVCQGQVDARQLSNAIEPAQHPHDRWLALNQEIPSFAGHYLQDGVPHMLLIQDAPAEDIERARAWAGDSSVVLTTATFTFIELHASWEAGRQIAMESVPEGHFYGYDLDEQQNVVWAGVATQEDVELATAAWADAGLPPNAFVAEVTEPSCFLNR